MTELEKNRCGNKRSGNDAIGVTAESSFPAANLDVRLSYVTSMVRSGNA